MTSTEGKSAIWVLTFSVLALHVLAQYTVSPVTVASGSVFRLEHFGSGVIPPRNIDIWVPDNYPEHGPYSVLYMHDGQMLYDSTTSWNGQEWQVDEVAGSLIAGGRIAPLIVVGIFNNEYRYAEYFPQKPYESLDPAFQDTIQKAKYYGRLLLNKTVCSDLYLEFIVDELKPYIDKHFRTDPDRAHTFIAGSSMGGLISMYGICEYPEIFGGAACLSTHWPGLFRLHNNPIPAAFADYLAEEMPHSGSHKFYFDYGTETVDSLYEPLQQMVDQVMFASDYKESNWSTIKYPGAAHTERSWSERLHVPLLFLLKQ